MDRNELGKILMKLSIWGYFCGGIVHLVGLYILHKVKINLINQRLLLINVAVIEMLFGILQTVLNILQPYLSHSFVFGLIDLCCICLLLTMYHLAMLHLTLDRLFDIYLHIKYPTVFQKEKLVRIIAFLWAASTTTAMGMVLLALTKHNISITLKYVMLVQISMDFIIIISFIVTYAYLFYKVKTLVQEHARVSGFNRGISRTNVKEKFIVPCVMVLTYIAFMFTSGILATLSHVKSAKPGVPDILLYSIANFLVIFGIISDAVIYIFLQRDNRDFILSCINRIKNRNSSESTTRGGSSEV